jgi:hypothetical protein
MFRLLTLLVIAATAITIRSDDSSPLIRVTVVAVLATTENNVVDPKLTALAQEVQKRDEALVGFKLVATAWKSIPVGRSHVFDLLEKQTLTVTVDKPRGLDGKIGLTVVPPMLGEISYECTCSKFFPVVTPYRTQKGEQLIIAVMAKPCTAGTKP